MVGAAKGIWPGKNKISELIIKYGAFLEEKKRVRIDRLHGSGVK
jgi:hypothetical protein